MGLDELFRQTDPLLEYIKGNEGFESNIYKDTKGIDTVGYGFNLTDPDIRARLPQDVVSGKRGMSEIEAEGILTDRVGAATRDAMVFVGDERVFNGLTGNQKTALIDMSFNLGLTRLSKFKKLRKAILAGDSVAAKREILDSKYAKKDVPNRALRNANLMLK